MSAACIVLAVVGTGALGIAFPAFFQGRWWFGLAVAGFGAAIVLSGAYLWLGYGLKLFPLPRRVERAAVPLLIGGVLCLAGALVWTTLTLLPYTPYQIFAPDDPRRAIVPELEALKKAEVLRNDMRWELDFSRYDSDHSLADVTLAAQYTVRNLMGVKRDYPTYAVFQSSPVFAEKTAAVKGKLTVSRDGKKPETELFEFKRVKTSNEFSFNTKVALGPREKMTVRWECLEPYQIAIPYSDYLLSVVPTEKVELVVKFQDTGLAGLVIDELRLTKSKPLGEPEKELEFPRPLADDGRPYRAEGPFLPYQGLEFTIFPK
jgi:hypothetical protein